MYRVPQKRAELLRPCCVSLELTWDNMWDIDWHPLRDKRTHNIWVQGLANPPTPSPHSCTNKGKLLSRVTLALLHPELVQDILKSCPESRAINLPDFAQGVPKPSRQSPWCWGGAGTGTTWITCGQNWTWPSCWRVEGRAWIHSSVGLVAGTEHENIPLWFTVWWNNEPFTFIKSIGAMERHLKSLGSSVREGWAKRC